MQKKLRIHFSYCSFSVFLLLLAVLTTLLAVAHSTAAHAATDGNHVSPVIFSESERFMASPAAAELRTVRGKGLDEKGEGMPGAHVSVKGASGGTVTGAPRSSAI